MSQPSLPFSQVDVFATGPLTGNPVAVVHDADELGEDRMAALARWTNLSETAFLLRPSDEGARAGADYRLRIFTPGGELPFAGHPTLGGAHAWLAAGGEPAVADRVVQECGIGPVGLRRDDRGELGFRAPALLRSGSVDPDTLRQAVAALRIAAGATVDANWVDNGPGWLGIRLPTAADVLALDPDFTAMGDLRIGVIGPHEPGGHADVEVRAFVPGLSVPEDPVTGSLNAGFATWLVGSGVLPGTYSARQGTALGRDGRVRVSTDEAGDHWVGGACASVVAGVLRT